MHIQMHTYTHTLSELELFSLGAIERKVDRQTDRETDRQTDRETDRQTDRETDRQTDRETDRQTDRETDRQTDRERDRQTDREMRNIHLHMNISVLRACTHTYIHTYTPHHAMDISVRACAHTHTYTLHTRRGAEQ